MSEDILAGLWEDESLSPLGLQDIPGFPYQAYMDQLDTYEEQERWYSGDALDDQPTEKGEETDLYPLRINPLKSTVSKHAHTLFGEVEDDGRPLVYPKYIYNSDAQKELAKELEDFMMTLWFENNGREIQWVNGATSQVHGGCVFKASYVPWESWRTIPIRIDRVHPKHFLGFPDGSDAFRLKEAWFVKKMRGSEAKDWGYRGGDPVVWYAEHWYRDRYEVLIDGMPAIYFDPVTKKTYPVGGVHPFGLIPMVYIPHERTTGNFLGENAMDNLYGLIKEMNLRYGDYGDAVNEDAHATIAVRNISGSINRRDLGEGREVFDLGNRTALSGNEGDPDMFEVNQQRASTPMQSLVESIWSVYRRDSFIPAVADGEDEGSQRSGLTLAIRFWPLTSHISIERVFWTVGMDVFNNILLRMALSKSKNMKDFNLTEAHLRLRSKQMWSPMLPRDREIEIQELVNRAAQQIAPIELLLEKAGDVEDIDEARQQILDWIEEIENIKAEAEMKVVEAQTKAMGGMNAPGGQSSTSAKNPAKNVASNPAGGS